MSASTTTLTAIPAGTYNVDPAHSSVGFEVRHMGIATVRGAFRRFQGTIEVTTADTPALSGTVDAASVDTGDEQRDAHLTAPDFFDVEAHPEFTFHSTATKPVDGGRISLAGEITMKGVTKPIDLVGVVAEGGADPWGNERIGLELETVIDRRDFGLTWNQTLPNGNLLVSNEVKIVLGISAVKAS